VAVAVAVNVSPTATGNEITRQRFVSIRIRLRPFALGAIERLRAAGVPLERIS
jgi:hypothetical protein